MSFKVEATSFARSVLNASHFRGNDKSLPVLCAIKLEYDGASLRCVTTDRYTLAIDSSTQIIEQGDAFDFLLDGEEVKRLVSFVTAGQIRGISAPVEISLDGDRLRAETLDRNISTFRNYDGQFPKYRSLMPAPDDEKATEHIALNPAHLARFSKVKTDRKLSSMRVRFYGATKPARFEIGETFIGLQMPVRLDESDWVARVA